MTRTDTTLRSGRALLAVATALLLVASVVPAGAVAAAQDSDGRETDDAGATTIDSCTTITDPGTYELSDDLRNATANGTVYDAEFLSVGACVVVASDDVVLDGGGNVVEGAGFDRWDANVANASINESGPTNATSAAVANASAVEAPNATDGPATAGNETANDTDAATANNESANATFDYAVGVAVRSPNGTDLTNVTVRNLTATNWSSGVFVENADSVAVTGVNATGNLDIGFELLNASNSTFEGLTADDNGAIGLYLSGGTDNGLADVGATNNSIAGHVIYESDRNEVVNATASGSTVAGVAVDSAEGNSFVGGAVRNTTGDPWFAGFSGGFVFLNASGNFVSGYEATNNLNWSYFAAADAADNLVLNLSTDDEQLSFHATDVALRTEPEPAVKGTSVTVANTSENASIVMDANWGEPFEPLIPTDDRT